MRLKPHFFWHFFYPLPEGNGNIKNKRVLIRCLSDNKIVDFRVGYREEDFLFKEQEQVFYNLIQSLS